MKNLKKWLVLLAALFVLTGMMSCEMFEDDEESLEVIGEWDTGYGSIIITDSTISWYGPDGSLSYAYKIISFSNDEWNGSEQGEGDFGYMVIQYTTAPSWNASVTDKYNIFRWQNFKKTSTASALEYGEAYKTGSYHDSIETAKTTATAAKGYYSYGYSPAANID